MTHARSGLESALGAWWPACALALCAVLIGCADNTTTPPAVDPDAPVLVTHGGGDRPTVSGDGQWIGFELPTPHHFFVARIHPDGSGQLALTDFCSQYPDWSRATNLVVFQCGEALYTVDGVSGDTQALAFTNFDSAPAWSPRGDRIAIKAAEGIALFDYPAGTRSSILCFDPEGGSCAGDDPAWSADGSWLAFDGGERILRVEVGGGTAQVIVEGMGDVATPACSPDGRYLAFVRVSATVPVPRREIWVVPLDGTGSGIAQQITRDFDDHDPVWSADSRSLVFASSRTGRTEIWRVRFQPTEAAGGTSRLESR